MQKNYTELEKSIYRLLEVTPIPSILSYATGKLEYVNPALKHLLGYDGEQIYSDDVIITHPDDMEISQAVRKTLKDNPFEPVKVEKRYVHKLGYVITASLYIVAQPDNDGNIERYISQIIDLRTLRQSEAAEVLLKHLVDLSSDAIYVVSPTSGQILNCNHLAHKRLGYSKDELLRLHVGDINRNLKETGNDSKWFKMVNKIKLEGELVIESSHTRKDGSEFPVEVNVNQSFFNNTHYLLAVARDITQRKKKESERLELCNLDPLTKLPNRRILHNRLPQIIEKSQTNNHAIVFMYIDLDNFKQINDQYGHAVGDGVLVGVANRLQRCIRQSDLIARMGGDEFLVVVNGLDKPKYIESIVSKVLQQFESPFNIDSNKLLVTASIGVSIHNATNLDVDVLKLIKWADEAMYQAKTHVGNTIVYNEKPSD